MKADSEGDFGMHFREDRFFADSPGEEWVGR